MTRPASPSRGVTSSSTDLPPDLFLRFLTELTSNQLRIRDSDQRLRSWMEEFASLSPEDRHPWALSQTWLPPGRGGDARYEARPGEYVYVSSDCLYLRLSLQGGGKRKIQLAGAAWFSCVVRPDQARLMLALTDVLAESPDCGATGQAVADLRMLATAPSGRVLQWMGTTGQLRPGQR